MCMRCRRRALMQACRNTSWQAGLSVLYTFIYEAEEIYDDTLYNIYFRFPRSKLVGENSEYVIKIAVHDGGDDIMNVGISVVPRGNPTGEKVPISADGKTAVSEVPIYLDSELRYLGTPNLSSVIIGGNTYYFIKPDAEELFDIAVTCAIDDGGGGGDDECPAGGNHEWSAEGLPGNGIPDQACTNCGQVGYLSWQQTQCKKCGEYSDIVTCGYCGYRS